MSESDQTATAVRNSVNTFKGRFTATNATKTGQVTAVSALLLIAQHVVELIRDGQIAELVSSATELGSVPLIATAIAAVVEWRRSDR